MKSMEKAQAEASQPGDQQLTCPPASAAENQAKVAQGAARMQSRMAQGMQMMAFMPKLMRGQRLIELGTALKCEWATGDGVPQIPNR